MILLMAAAFLCAGSHLFLLGKMGNMGRLGLMGSALLKISSEKKILARSYFTPFSGVLFFAP
ncbi:MAG: hypothetical protein IJT13_00545 [Bacteroidaceae bacterium]|nr:hypothetical protein [Bacteroidaceae bacterium]